MSVQFFDKFNVSTREITESGFLRANATFTRAGVFKYATSMFDQKELPEHLKDKKVIRVLRPASELEKSVAQFAHVPVTDGHPTEDVSPDNVKVNQVGMSLGFVEFKDNFIFGKILIQHKDAIRKVQNDKDELSAGYTADLVLSPGVDKTFGEYDAIQTNLKINHIAIVKHGRSGPKVRVLDELNKEINMIERTYNDVTLTFADESSAEAFDTILAEREETKADIDEPSTTVSVEDEAEVNTELIAKDKEIKDMSEEIETLKGKLDAEVALRPSPEDIDKLVTSRLKLVDEARSLHDDIEATGLTDLDIKRTVIAKSFGDKLDITEKDEQYIDGVFTSLLLARKEEDKQESKKLAKSFSDAATKENKPNNKQLYEDSIVNAWKSK